MVDRLTHNVAVNLLVDHTLNDVDMREFLNGNPSKFMDAGRVGNFDTRLS